jgi:hypothetical protein
MLLLSIFPLSVVLQESGRPDWQEMLLIPGASQVCESGRQRAKAERARRNLSCCFV